MHRSTDSVLAQVDTTTLIRGVDGRGRLVGGSAGAGTGSRPTAEATWLASTWPSASAGTVTTPNGRPLRLAISSAPLQGVPLAVRNTSDRGSASTSTTSTAKGTTTPPSTVVVKSAWALSDNLADLFTITRDVRRVQGYGRPTIERARRAVGT
jgi:hypothetical protein